tara:strand:+ start:1928 stop:3676 length:1749 start_codon:yes stop_codon:yes gene_type:complete
MKWIGQHIVDLIARFRGAVYLEDINTGTIASGSNLGLDSNNKIVKAAESSGGISHDGSTANGVLTFKDADEATVEANLTFDGSSLNINGAAEIASAGKLYFRDQYSFIQSPSANDLLIAAAVDFEIESSTIVLDAGASIELDAVSAITLKTGDSEFLDFKNVNNTFARFYPESGNNTTLTLYEQGGDSLVDYCSITVQEHGATTIGTVDAAAAAAHLNFTVDGNFSVASTGIDIATDGTITNAVWNGTAIASAYIADDAVTEDKLANTLLAEIDENTTKVSNVTTNLSQTTASDSLRIESSDGTNVTIAEASGSIAGVMTVAHHVKLDAIEAEATADQTKSDIDGLAITTVGTLDTGNATAIVDAASLTAAGKVELATTGEADTGTDAARAVTPAGLKSHVDARYAYQYVMFHASDTIKSNWITFGGNGLSNHTWGTDTSDSGVTVGSSTMSCTNVMQAAGFKIPFACKLIGFYGTGYRFGGSNSFAAGVFILDSPDYNSEASGSTVDTLNATLRAYAAAEDGGVSNPFNQKLNKVVDTGRSFDCPAGSMIFPAFKDTAGVNSGAFRGNMTVILATPIVTIA